jgi:N-acyl-D-amino-acid deacylase
VLDFIFENGLIFDGTGKPPVVADLGVAKGRIVLVGDGSQHAAIKRINATGLALSPGFIDGHTHGEGYVFSPSKQFSGKLWQGVTSEILGNCGISVFPVLQDRKEDIKGYFGPFSGPYQLDWNWSEYASIRDSAQYRSLLNNAGSLVGHGSLRIAVMGFERRKPSSTEMEGMINLLERAFDQGAVGLSLGLMYPPGLYAEMDELSTLAEVAARFGKVVTVHMRSETFHLLDSVNEVIAIAKKSGARFVISHLKAVGRKNWGGVREALNIINGAQSQGYDIYCDVYPYTAGNTVLRALLPPWALEGGITKMLARLQDPETRIEMSIWMEKRADWENLGLAAGWDAIMIQATKRQHHLEGKFIDELARESGLDPINFIFDLLLAEDGEVMMLLFTASEEDLVTALRQQYCMVGSDGIPSTARPHPRLFGTFPRFLSRYVLEKGLMSLEEGIRRITALPAKVYGFSDRGQLKKGFIADFIAFSPEHLKDSATYNKPEQYASGIRYLIINGKAVIDDGELTNIRAGRIIVPDSGT